MRYAFDQRQISGDVVGDGNGLEYFVEAPVSVGVQFVDHAVFAAETRVHIHRAHARFGGDSPDGKGVRAGLGEQPVGGLQKRFAGFVV